MKRTELKRKTPLRSRTPLQAARSAVQRRRKTTVGEFTRKQRQVMYDRWGGRCAACGDPLPRSWWTAQHRRARQYGGSRDPLITSLANGVAVHQVPCHESIEANPTKALDDGFRIPQGTTDPQEFPLTIWTGEKVYLNSGGGYWAEPGEDQ